ncbi:hypothetical protein [Hymenobacter coccineus]|uniref:Uncharacterized protein n=1 Tax=Hymenobacter coccineus TaxID=1908235 RepID=A0A1G1TGY6_9BACT|nr:hypothetical protein [Hymenobacter coccineus]OGX90141.1 hypothetical protein BEN49_23740 [Hymenobacter coccineus]
MLKLLSYGLGFCLLLVLLGTYVLFWGPDAWNGRRNWQNSYRVHPGMPVRAARAIMGPSIRKSVQPDYVSYFYDPQPVAADLISISVGRDSLVAFINHGDD